MPVSLRDLGFEMDGQVPTAAEAAERARAENEPMHALYAGVAAFREGQPLAGNPFFETEAALHDHWRDGWHVADRARRLREARVAAEAAAVETQLFDWQTRKDLQ